MNGSDLLLTTPVTPPGTLETTLGAGLTAKTGDIRSNNVKSADDKKTEKIAKDFESVLLTKLLDEMKNTIGNGLGEDEAGSEQVKGLFWLYLARDVADKGGLGLWKDLNRFFTDLQNQDTQAKSLDEKL
jgi:Rod binding domain-containing protein